MACDLSLAGAANMSWNMQFFGYILARRKHRLWKQVYTTMQLWPPWWLETLIHSSKGSIYR